MSDTKFQPGQSGNPAGRPKGTGKFTRWRTEIEAHVPELIAKLSEQAKAGDLNAARMLLDRVFPPLRAVDPAESVDLDGQTLTERGQRVFTALADGTLAPQQATQLIGALVGLAKLIETDELAARIAALEGQSGNKP